MTKRHALRAILFDMGGTLERLTYDLDLRLKATTELLRFLAESGARLSLSPSEFHAHVDAGHRGYQAHQTVANQELPPERIWGDFILAGLGIPTSTIEELADELSDFFETRFFRRELREEAPEVLASLRQRGFTIGMISNTISRTSVPLLLDSYGIRDYFDPIVLSVVYGLRKPHPHIFLHAANLSGVAPESCAYVGDTVSRDVLGARRAGFGLVVQIPSFLSSQVDKGDEGIEPDARINDLRELLDLVGERDLV